MYAPIRGLIVPDLGTCPKRGCKKLNYLKTTPIAAATVAATIAAAAVAAIPVIAATAAAAVAATVAAAVAITTKEL